MQLSEISLSGLILILFGILAIFTFVASIKMPSGFSKDEKVRAELKRKLYENEKIEKEENQVN